MSTAAALSLACSLPSLVHHAGASRVTARLNLPVYLDADVQAYLTAVATRKGVPLSAIANDLLKREIELIEAVK